MFHGSNRGWKSASAPFNGAYDAELPGKRTNSLLPHPRPLSVRERGETKRRRASRRASHAERGNKIPIRATRSRQLHPAPLAEPTSPRAGRSFFREEVGSGRSIATYGFWKQRHRKPASRCFAPARGTNSSSRQAPRTERE